MKKFIVLLGLYVGFLHAQAQNSSPLPTKDAASSATASAVPGTAHYIGGIGSGNLKGIIACDSSTFISVSTASSTQLAALTSGKSVYICAFAIVGGGTGTVKFQSATAASCGGTLTQLTPAFNYGINTTVALGSGLGTLFTGASGTAICATTSAAVLTSVFISYTVF